MFLEDFVEDFDSIVADQDGWDEQGGSSVSENESSSEELSGAIFGVDDFCLVSFKYRLRFLFCILLR